MGGGMPSDGKLVRVAVHPDRRHTLWVNNADGVTQVRRDGVPVKDAPNFKYVIQFFDWVAEYGEYETEDAEDES